MVSDNNRTRYVLSNSVIITGPSLSVIVIDTFSKKKLESINTVAENEVVDFESFKWKTFQKLNFDSIPTLTAEEAKSTWFVGIDVGQTFAVGVCAKNSGLGTVRNLAIKSKALRIPQKRFQKYLAEKKNTFHGSFEAERDMTRKPSETLTGFAKRWFQKYCFLHSLYNSRAMKKRKWDLERAIEAEFSIAVNSILKMVNKKISRKVSTKCRRNYIFAVGSSDVQGSDNIHTAFGTYLVKKLQSLGYVVVTVDEDFTSQKCPRCSSQSEAVCMRVKYCRICHQYFHRDVMAGENMINIVRGLAVDGIRPEYLCRKPPDNPEIGDSNDSGDETIHAQTETDQSNRASSYRILTRSQKRLDKSAQK